VHNKAKSVHFVVVCRLKCGLKVTDRKILYLNNRHYSQSSSKKSRSKQRVHLLFDDDGNAADANSEGSSVTQRVKSFLEAVETEPTEQRTSNQLQFSSEAVEDSLEAVCSINEQNLCSDDVVSNAVVVTAAEPCSSSSTVDLMDACSSCQAVTEEAAAAAAATESGNCSDKETEAEMICDNEVVARTSSSMTSDVASSDPELSKYWWQRYRLFSRFDKGIMIDRGWLCCCGWICLLFI